MVRELNHRVRNILTLVQSLSGSTRQSASSIENYASSLEQRIIALARAHDLLTREDTRQVSLNSIASLELQPYFDNTNDAVLIDGPEIILNPDVTPIMALVIHELVSNAAKYGALSKNGGSVSLTWAVTESELCIKWQERGGPAVVQSEHEGFGRSIIENAIPYEFDGRAMLTFEPSGIQAEFGLPGGEFTTGNAAPEIGDGASENELINSREEKIAGERTLNRGLIVEDNFVIARESQRWLEDIGFKQSVSVSTISQALEQLQDNEFDFCLLDVNLRGAMSGPVAQKLTELDIPFIFASGYGSDGKELCNSFEATILTKPLDIDELKTALKKLELIE